MRLIFLVIIFISLSSPAFGAFKDVPENHWSNPAIYDLVSKGITQGYPDGTFQGERKISRFEVAAFLSKLDNITTDHSAVSEKLVAELKVELRNVKEELRQLKEGGYDEAVKVSGSATLRGRAGSAGDPEGPSMKTDYRLLSDFSSKIGSNFSVKLSLDTLDAGFNGNERGLIREMFAVEGKTTINVFGFLGDLIATAGPGLVIHRESSNFLTDDYSVYEKPDTSLSFATVYRGYYVSASYIARELSYLGEPYANEFTATVKPPKFDFPVVGETAFSLTPRYVFRNSSLSSMEAHDFRGEAQVKIQPLPKIEGTLLLGLKSGSSDGTYVNIGVEMKDYFNTGTDILLSLHSVGSDYRTRNLNKYEYGLINLFDKLILDGTSDLSVKVTQIVFDNVKAYVKGDIVMTENMEYGEDYDGTSFSLEEGIIISLYPAIQLKICYRIYEVPSGVADAADPENLKRNVEPSSNVFSIGFTYDF